MLNSEDDDLQHGLSSLTKLASPKSVDMSAVGFEPTSANTVELESTPLDHSGTLTMWMGNPHQFQMQFYEQHTL